MESFSKLDIKEESPQLPMVQKLLENNEILMKRAMEHFENMAISAATPKQLSPKDLTHLEKHFTNRIVQELRK